MTQSQPAITRTTHTLPFDRLSWHDFERLCLALLLREGSENPQHYGAAGGEQGRDIVACRNGELWYVQCKRIKQCGPQVLLDEVKNIRGLMESDPDLRPTGYLFIAACDVSATARDRASKRCAELCLACEVWGQTDLDARVQQYPDIVALFFGITGTIAVLRKLFPESKPAFEHLLEDLRQLIEHHETLQEWKDLHHRLHTCLIRLGPFKTEVELIYNSVGYYWDAKRGKRLWNPFKDEFESLMDFAKRINRIGTKGFYENDHVWGGESWVVEIVRAINDVQDLVGIGGVDVEELHDRTIELARTYNRYLRDSDFHLRDVASKISVILDGALRSISQ